MSDTTIEQIKDDANKRISQWDAWSAFYDPKVRSHKRAFTQVEELRDILSDKSATVEDIEDQIEMVKTAFRSAPRESEGEPAIMGKGAQVVPPSVKGLSNKIQDYGEEAFLYMLEKFPAILHLVRTPWSAKDGNGGLSYADTGMTAQDFARAEAKKLANNATSVPYRAYHTNSHEKPINVVVLEFDGDEYETIENDGLTIPVLTAYRNKPSTNGGHN